MPYTYAEVVEGIMERFDFESAVKIAVGLDLLSGKTVEDAKDTVRGLLEGIEKDERFEREDMAWSTGYYKASYTWNTNGWQLEVEFTPLDAAFTQCSDKSAGFIVDPKKNISVKKK